MALRQEYIIVLIVVRVLRDLERSGEGIVESIGIRETLRRSLRNDNLQGTQRPTRTNEARLNPRNTALNTYLHEPQQPATVDDFRFNLSIDQSKGQRHEGKSRKKGSSFGIKWSRESRCSIQ
jgi:hypothetical protein